MALSYSKTAWVNGSPPAVNATNLNHAEDGIKAVSDALDTPATMAPIVATAIEAGTATTTPNDTDKLGGAKADHSLLYYTWTNIWVWVQAKIHGAANKDTLVDADKFAIIDTEASNVVKTTTWSNIKTKILALFYRAGNSTPVGLNALPSATATAVNNTAVGVAAGFGVTEGDSNTLVGYRSGQAITTGGTNTAVGVNALSELVTGADNVALGQAAGQSLTGAAAQNTLIGNAAGYNASQKVDAVNSIAIGAGAHNDKDNQAVIGNASVTETVLRGAVTIPSVTTANKDTLVDADKFIISDTEASGATKSTTWGNLKTKIKELFSGLDSLTNTPADDDEIIVIEKSDATAPKRYSFLNFASYVADKIGKVNAAIGFTLAGGTTSKTLTVSADADTVNVPTTAEKTRLSDIQASSGATTALKLANLTTNASTTQEGVVELATSAEISGVTTEDGRAISSHELKDATALADFWLTKRTKMPDGATAVYSQDVWAGTVDGWLAVNGTRDSTTNAGYLTGIASGAGGNLELYKNIPNGVGKTLLLVIEKGSSNSPVNCRVKYGSGDAVLIPWNGNSRLLVNYKIGLGTADTNFYVQPNYTVTDAAGTQYKIDWYWIGDYSYLPGSLSEEATRIADQLGDTPGVGAAATATITSNGTNVNTPAAGLITIDAANVADNSTIEIAHRLFTFVPSLSGAAGVNEVLKGATNAITTANLKLATNYTTPATYDYTVSGGAGTAVYSVPAAATTVKWVGLRTLGSGYTNADVVTIVQSGGSAATATLTVAAGVVTAIVITDAGSGYTTGLGLSVTGGTGTGLKVDILTTGGAHGLVSATTNSPTNTLLIESKYRGTCSNTAVDVYATWNLIASSDPASNITLSASTLGTGTGSIGGVDDTVTIGGKVYTFVGALSATRVEGEVLVGTTYETIANFSLAINRQYASIRDYDGTTPRYNIAAPNPLVYATYNSLILTVTVGYASGTNNLVLTQSTGIPGNSITISKVGVPSGTVPTLTLANPAGGTTTLAGGIDDVGAKIKTQNNAALGYVPAGTPNRTSTATPWYVGIIDVASGASGTLPSGGTFLYEVQTYGATYNSVMAAIVAGGAISGTASANLRIRYQRLTA